MKQQNKDWHEYLSEALRTLTENKPLAFAKMIPSNLPTAAGVYIISAQIDNEEIPYYVGRTTNLRQRLYNNHLMGPFANARLKKYLVNAGECTSIGEAKNFIRKYCQVRLFLEDDTRKRGAVEGYVTGMVFPKYGIYEEH